MAVLTVYLLLLLFSILHAITHGELCPEESYCPAGVDCNSNSSLCEGGVCEATTEENCVRDILLEFGSSSYDVNENNGPAQPVLTLDAPLECCSISVTVKVEDISAKGDEDYEIPSNQYVKVRFSAGQTRVSFDVNIIDDDLMENSETFRITIYDLSVPYGITLGFYTSAEVTIVDNDSTTLSFSKSTFHVNETEGPAQPELALSVPALFDFNVFITSVNVDLSERCDNFQSGPFEVIFPNGTTRITFPVNITDDDVYEEYESFNLVIDNNLPNRVNLGYPNRAAIVIADDEKPIIASFDKNVYRVHEHQGTIAPEIKLSEPSPCCFILHAKLNNDTALGRTIDYGYASPKIYNYTFHAGSTCASPDANITITDDLISENEETFEISIIEAALPFGVKAGGTATIFINDNDNAVWYRYADYTAREDGRRVWLQLVLEEPATSDRIIQIGSYDINATGGDDYALGPYSVSFQKGDTKRYFSIPIINDESYEGDEYFNVTIDTLPHGIVRVHPYTAIVKIEDDEYIFCFKEQNYSVEEGKNVQLTLTLSRPLPTALIVLLEYDDIETSSGSDYYASPKSVKFKPNSIEASITIMTREDSSLEKKRESFYVSIKHPSQPNNTDGCDKAKVAILDDDDVTIKFTNSEYSSTTNSPAKPRLVLNKVTNFPIRVTIHEEGGTAIDGVDYEKQHYRDVLFLSGGSTYLDLTTKRNNDELVEGNEFYYLTIEPDTLPERVTAVSPSTTKIILVDDDVSIVNRKDNVVLFSKAIDHPIEVKAFYYNDGGSETITLLPGEKSVTLDASRITKFQRITLTGECPLERRRFSIQTYRIYMVIPKSCPNN